MLSPWSASLDSGSFQGWFYAAEVFHFAHYLAKGKCRFMETLFMPPESVLHSTLEWDLLKQFVDRREIVGEDNFGWKDKLKFGLF